MTDPETRHSRGLLVVILLGVIFFALLALILVKSGKPRPAEPADAEMLTVLPLKIRIRTEPNARAAVVATASSGDTLRLLEDQGAWVRVENDDGLSGWAERGNLERTAERERRLARYQAIRKLPALAGVTSRRTQLYAGPGIFYPLVGEIPAGTGVTVFTRDHDFFAVAHRETVAYADIESVDVTASGSRQLDVETTSAPPLTATDSTATLAPTETVAETTPFEPPPVVEPPSAELIDRSGVYSAVPPDGTQPEEIDRVVPRYPQMARRMGTSGSVVIRGIVRRDGRIDDVEVIKDLPNGLGDAAREAVRKWRFRPATYRGEPIDV
ncbi:MAG: TonB family protein, partial [Thermoanaerobaculia bacterium]|nr:TonB family protein [Thermoanaerobaculia bacterium]